MTTDRKANGLGCLEFHPQRAPEKVDLLLRRAILGDPETETRLG
jgi:hypothetical protein